MARVFQIRRGPRARLPVLAQGELAMTTDSGTEALWLGTGSANKKIPVDPTPADVGAVSKTGDTMTGDLHIETASNRHMEVRNTDSGRAARVHINVNHAQFHNMKDNDDYTALVLGTEEDTINNMARLRVQKGGHPAFYHFFHTGSKPSGSYTGNGSAEERTVEIGGIHAIGSVLSIATGGYIAGLVFYSGALLWNTETGVVVNLDYTKANYRGGVLTIATDSTAINSNGVSYYYQVL